MLRKLLTVCIIVLALTAVGCMPESLFGQKRGAKGDPFERVVTGLNERQVVALLGEPNRRQQITAGEVPEGHVQLIYRWIQSDKIIKVYFLDGLVVGKERI
jgi:hypothetical protein